MKGLEALLPAIVEKLTPLGLTVVIVALILMSSARTIIAALELRQTRSLNRKMRRREVRDDTLPPLADEDQEVTNPGRRLRRHLKGEHR